MLRSGRRDAASFDPVECNGCSHSAASSPRRYPQLRSDPSPGDPHAIDRFAATMLLVAAGVAVGSSAVAQVAVTDAWVRGTVTGQKATGAFMQLKSPADASLVAVSSPVAKIVGSPRNEDGGRHDEDACRRQGRAARRQGGRVEARRLPRDADGSRQAAEGRRHGAAAAHVRGQGRQERDGRGEGRGEAAHRGRRRPAPK